MQLMRGIPDQPCELYLDLLKRCLTRELFIEEEVQEVPDEDLHRCVSAETSAMVARAGWRVVCPSGRRADREEGLDWPPTAETMIGLRRLDNLHECIRSVLIDRIPGDLMEAGVWRGGATIFMRAALAAYADSDRRVIVADSFNGLPPPDVDRYPCDSEVGLSGEPFLAVDEPTVRRNFQRYGMLDDKVVFLPGWFCNSLPTAPVEQLAILRVDADLYQSTTEVLSIMYPKVSVGGFVIIDDFGAIPACRAAVEDFRERHGVQDELTHIDRTGVYWRRTGTAFGGAIE